MKRIFFIILLLAVIVGGLVWYGFSSRFVPATSSSDKIQVVATFYPLAHFAEAVGRDYVHVTQHVPAGAEPHNFEPTPQDIITMTQALMRGQKKLFQMLFNMVARPWKWRRFLLYCGVARVKKKRLRMASRIPIFGSTRSWRSGKWR